MCLLCRVQIVSCDDVLNDGPPLEVDLLVVRADPLVSPAEGVHAYAAAHADEAQACNSTCHITHIAILQHMLPSYYT